MAEIVFTALGYVVAICGATLAAQGVYHLVRPILARAISIIEGE